MKVVFKKHIIPIFALFISWNAKSQALDSSYWQGWYETPADVVNVTRWEGKGWLTAGGIVTTGLIIHGFDDDIRTSFQNFRSPSSDRFSQNFAEPIGSGLYSLGGSALLLGVGYLTDDERLQRTSYQAFKAFILTGGATVILKQLTHRPRPYEIPNPNLWYGPTGISGTYDAFPSGHTSTAFAVASVYAHSYADKPWVGITAYSLASLTGLSRIHDDVHWASDVFFGAAFGWYVGRTIVKTDSQLMILPTGNGVSVSYRFD